VEQSPLAELLAAIDKLDVEAAMALCAADCTFVTADGRHAEGHPAVTRLLDDFLSVLRSTSHEITAMWHQGDMWIAETLSSYELRDRSRLEQLRRAFFVRAGSDGILAVRVYGANERRLTERSDDEPMRIGGRLILPL
jgi:ketosteroid isomerase-like protein